MSRADWPPARRESRPSRRTRRASLTAPRTEAMQRRRRRSRRRLRRGSGSSRPRSHEPRALRRAIASLAGAGRWQLALDERLDCVLHLVNLLAVDVHLGRPPLCRVSQAGEELRDRSGVEPGCEEPVHRLAVVADEHRAERLRAVRLVELPVLLQLPDEEPEHARQEEDRRAGDGVEAAGPSAASGAPGSCRAGGSSAG